MRSKATATTPYHNWIKQHWPSLSIAILVLLFCAYLLSGTPEQEDANLPQVLGFGWEPYISEDALCNNELTPGSYYEFQGASQSFEFYYSRNKQIYLLPALQLALTQDSFSAVHCEPLKSPTHIEEL